MTPQDIKATIARLREEMARATPRPCKVDDYGIYIWGANQEMVADNDDEEAYLLRMRGVGAKLPIIDNRDLLVDAVNSLPAILDALEDAMRKAEAGERLAEAMREMDGMVISPAGNAVTAQWHEWRDQCDAALAAYDEAIKATE